MLLIQTFTADQVLQAHICMRAVKQHRVTYNGPLLRRLDLCLQVRRRMEVAARLAVAPALDEVHTHRDVVVGVDGHAIRRMSVATLGLCASAHTALVLATNLFTQRERVSTNPGTTAAVTEQHTSAHPDNTNTVNVSLQVN